MLPIHFSVKNRCRLRKQCLSYNSTPLPGELCLPITRNRTDPSWIYQTPSLQSQTYKTLKDVVSSNIFKKLIKSEVVVERALNRVQRFRKTQTIALPCPVYLMFVRLLSRRENMCLKSTLSNGPALFPTSFLPLLAYPCQEQSKMGVCGCLLSDSLLGARKRKLLTWMKRKQRRYFPEADKEQTGTRSRWVRRNWGWD